MTKKIQKQINGEELALKTRKLEMLRKREEITEGLPHLYGQKFYKWSREFFDSKNKYTFLVAANQVGKSSIQIRRIIDWATNKEKWPDLWATQPLMFWYLYPTKEVATIEFDKKWVTTFLPRGKYKDDPVYGWEAEYKNKFIFALHFKSGVSIYFKTYATDVSHLQTSTAFYIATDEELPIDLWDELNMRIAATNGYISMVFTATLAQDFWRQTMEVTGRHEKMKGAKKIHASLYDCLTFEDGTPSHWTTARIKQIENSCRSEAEILKRVYGRFIKDEGLKYASFSRDINVIPPIEIPSNFGIYVGVDIGSGGEKGHPSAISFVAVSPDYSLAYVFRGWRGDKVVTTCSDVVQKYKELRGNLNVIAMYYDWSSKEFFNIAIQSGLSVMPAEKSHEIGEQTLNVLFKNGALKIFDTPDLHPLIEELQSLDENSIKRKAADDMIDSLRYSCTRIPWQWSKITNSEVSVNEPLRNLDNNDRRSFYDDEERQFGQSIEDELQAWGELYEI